MGCKSNETFLLLYTAKAAARFALGAYDRETKGDVSSRGVAVIAAEREEPATGGHCAEPSAGSGGGVRNKSERPGQPSWDK